MECLPQNIAHIRPSTKCGQKTHTEDYQILIKVRTSNSSEASIKYIRATCQSDYMKDMP